MEQGPPKVRSVRGPSGRRMVLERQHGVGPRATTTRGKHAQSASARDQEERHDGAGGQAGADCRPHCGNRERHNGSDDNQSKTTETGDLDAGHVDDVGGQRPPNERVGA